MRTGYLRLCTRTSPMQKHGKPHQKKLSSAPIEQKDLSLVHLAGKKIFIFGAEHGRSGLIAEELRESGAEVIFSEHSPSDYGFPSSAVYLVAQEVRKHKPDVCLIYHPAMDLTKHDIFKNDYAETTFANHSVVRLARTIQSIAPTLIVDRPEPGINRRTMMENAGAKFLNIFAENKEIITRLVEMVSTRAQAPQR